MKEKGLLRERSYSAAVPYIMEDIDEETRIKRARVSVAFRVEFNSSEEMDEQVSMYFDGVREEETLAEKDETYITEKYKKIVEKIPEIRRDAECICKRMEDFPHGTCGSDDFAPCGI